MDLLELFYQYLQSKENTLSKITVKNYKADIHHFFIWFEKQWNKPFSPQDGTKEILALYKNSDILTARSMKRHVSSLKKFFYFLQHEGHSTTNPFELEHTTSQAVSIDRWHVKAFKNYLYVNNSSHLTIKNYITDVQQCMKWLEDTTGIQETWHMLTPRIIDTYKNRMLAKGLSPTSINRKLSSLRKYLQFLKNKGIMTNTIVTRSLDVGNVKLDIAFFKSNLSHEEPQASYSKFPPLRLVQKIGDGTNMIFDMLLISPLVHLTQKTQETAWQMKGRPIFVKTAKHEYPFHKRLFNYLRYSRPEWYTKYHRHAIANYVHLSLLIVFIATLGIFYKDLFASTQSSQSVLGLTNSMFQTPQTFSFQGRLTDNSNNAITKPSAVRFGLYNSSTAFGNALLWEETQTVSPDTEGKFSTTLGKEKTIPASIIMENPSLYLGITVGADKELTPRQLIPNTSYAANADTLQGLPLITQADAPMNNVVLALDSAGNVSMTGKSHTVQAMNGQLAVSGEKLILATNTGSNGNIQLVPDGSGKIDLQKPIHNSTNNNNIPSAAGAVEVDDLFAILATSSAQTAFTVNQNGGGPLISASSSGTAKFTVGNDGSTYVAGNMGIGMPTPIAKLQVAGSVSPGATNTYDLGSPSLYWNALYVKTLISPSSGTFGYWQRTQSSISPTNITDAFNLGATASSSATVHFAGALGDASFVKGNMGIGTATPNAMFHVQGSGTSTGVSLLTTDSSGKQRFMVLDNGNVGIGTTSPMALLDVAGAGRFNCTNNFTNTTGTTSCSDVAEVYDTDEQMEKGDVIRLGSPNKVEKTTKAYDAIIGVYSTSPGLLVGNGATIGSDNDVALPKGKVPVALVGRVPVKVTTENGNIAVGDYLTSSPIPGYAMKATRAGQVLGRAMENFDCDKTICQAKIMVFVNVSWYDPAPGIVASLENLVAQFKEITTNVLKANTIISPIAQIDEIHTHIISPLSPDGDVIVQLASPSATHISKFVIQNASGSAVASIDSSGSAKFAGSIEANSASISGILRAKKIVADQIEGLMPPLTGIDIASYSAQLGYVTNLNTTFGTFTQGLISLGSTSLSDTTITGQLSIGANLILADSSINVLGSDLQIQPLRQGGVSFLSGLVRIDTNGNLQTQGDVSVRGKLSAGVISPLPDGDLIISLPSHSGLSRISSDSGVATTSAAPQNDNAKFIIQNASGSAVLSINSIGDLIASGEASIKKLNIQLVQDAIALSSTEVIASGSAGIATISAQKSTLTIDNPLVTEKSLIYITPRDETNNQTLFLLRQVPNSSFTIGIQKPTTKDIPFNWLLVN